MHAVPAFGQKETGGKTMLNEEEKREVNRALQRIIKECESVRDCSACEFYTAFGDSNCKLAGFPIKWDKFFR